MGVDYYLLPKTPINGDPVFARDWLEREDREFGEIPGAVDPAIETRKRKLAALLLKMKRSRSSRKSLSKMRGASIATLR
jgi:hypothetical protein